MWGASKLQPAIRFVNKALLQHSLAYSVGPRPLSHHNGRLEEVWRRPHGLKSGPLQNKLAGPLFIPQPECPNAISSCSLSAQNSPMIPEVTMAESLPTCHLFVFILTGEPQLCVDISCPNTLRTWPRYSSTKKNDYTELISDCCTTNWCGNQPVPYPSL